MGRSYQRLWMGSGRATTQSELHRAAAMFNRGVAVKRFGGFESPGRESGRRAGVWQPAETMLEDAADVRRRGRGVERDQRFPGWSGLLERARPTRAVGMRGGVRCSTDRRNKGAEGPGRNVHGGEAGSWPPCGAPAGRAEAAGREAPAGVPVRRWRWGRLGSARIRTPVTSGVRCASPSSRWVDRIHRAGPERALSVSS
jgi:hypothetical protein